MFFLDIDEMSINLRLAENSIKLEDLEKVEQYIVNSLIDRLQLRNIGSIDKRLNGSNGYTDVYAVDNLVWLSYSTNRADMGIYLWFSASALKEIKAKNKMDVINICQIINAFCNDYEYLNGWHITRIDTAIDFIDMGVGVSDIYKKVADKTDIPYFTSYDRDGNLKKRALSSNINAVINNGEINTIYFGSRGAKTNLVTRIYNKKQEVLDKANSYYFEKAMACNDWVRIEYSLRNKYAKQITNYLDFEIINYDELCRWLLNECLCRMSLGEKISVEGKVSYADNDIYTMLRDFIGDVAPVMHLNPNKVSSLTEKYIWHMSGQSGLLNYIYAIKKIYGNYAPIDFITSLSDYVDSKGYEPNDDVVKYLNTYGDDDKKAGAPWFNKNLAEIITMGVAV